MGTKFKVDAKDENLATCCAYLIVVPVLYAAIIAIASWLISTCWNSVIPKYFGWTTITFNDTVIFILLAGGIGWVLAYATRGIRSRPKE